MPAGASLDRAASPQPDPFPKAGARPVSLAHSAQSLSRTDSVLVPLALSASFLVLYLLTLAGAHTFDSLAYIRDMGKPLAALVLPHHLFYEPLVYAFHNLWRVAGWQGDASVPAQVLGSFAGAGGLALFYKIACELGVTRPAALLASTGVGLSYGYWFYSVEVDIYLLPLFFLLLAAWLFLHAAREGGLLLFALAGLAHGAATIFHQASLIIVPAFALGAFLLPGDTRNRIIKTLSYLVALAAVVGPAYFVAGVVIAGQHTPADFLKWANSYGNLGTWGGIRPDSLEATVSGASAAASSDFWTGRLVLAAMVLLVLLRARAIVARSGAVAVTLLLWAAIYALFFAWWQPEVLKFWVLVLPPLALLALLAFRWESLPVLWRRVAASGAALAVATLALTNAPAVWALRDPMHDTSRQTSDALGRLAGPEDLIVLQSGTAELQLPYYYDRPNVISTRELWYSEGGQAGRANAVSEIERRVWHALAKGENAWIEDRVRSPGLQISDHFVFTPAEISAIMSPYGQRVDGEPVKTGPQTFSRLSPDRVYDTRTEWRFAGTQEGWSGVNIADERIGAGGWCFTTQGDPNLYGPPMQLPARGVNGLTIAMSSSTSGKAQLFFRTDYTKPYSEENSIRFDVAEGEHIYALDLTTAPGWTGVISGLRLDPLEDAGSNICAKGLHLGKAGRALSNSSAPVKR